MKKLSKLKLHNATLLNDREMKNIVGGYGDGYDGYGSGIYPIIVGVRCDNKQCYCDKDWGEHYFKHIVECDIPCSMWDCWAKDVYC